MELYLRLLSYRCPACGGKKKVWRLKIHDLAVPECMI
jgi:hypothetical protein